MAFLIDGHNLIPKIPGLSLRAMDDENQLIELLQEFCRLQRKQVEVYFDKAATGGVPARNYGSVIARFVRQGSTADQAIHQRLVRLGRSARNWTVVSSDQAVQTEARAAHARVISSDEFARTLLAALDENRRDQGAQADTKMDSQELDDWLRLFGEQGEG